MTFLERIENEKNNLNNIVLYNDGGLFFCLIERSAYAFFSRIRPLKVRVKNLKGLKTPYVSIGVPVAKINEYLRGMDSHTDCNGNIVVSLMEPIDEKAFHAWKCHVINQKEGLIDNNLNEINKIVESFVDDIVNLDIANMSPMEAMRYLACMKNKLMLCKWKDLIKAKT